MWAQDLQSDAFIIISIKHPELLRELQGYANTFKMKTQKLWTWPDGLQDVKPA